MSDVKDLEVFKCLCEYASDGLYVFDPERRRFTVANAALERISGYSRPELLSPSFDPLTLVHIDDRGLFPWDGTTKEEGEDQRLEARLITKTGETVNVELVTLNTSFDGKEYRIGSIKDISDRMGLESKLREEVSLHRRNTIEAAKSSVRIYQLTERIRNVPRLTTSLLNAATEDELFQEASQTLCEKMGLAYAGVSFFLREGETLHLKFSTNKKVGRRYAIDKNTRYAKALREGKESTHGGTKILPLKSRNAVIGLMEILFDEKERILFDESESVKQGQSDIVRTIAHMIGLMIENLRLYEQVKQQSVIDELTQTYNRRYFDKKIAAEFQRATRYRRDLSLIIIDLDNFKVINDSAGHQQGDLVLKEVAGIFKKSTRDVDTICRYGGDEFVVLLPETNKGRAQAKAENLRRLIEAHSFTRVADPNDPIVLSISIGVSSLTPRATSQDDLFRAADHALYDAKRLGRNLVCTAEG